MQGDNRAFDVLVVGAGAIGATTSRLLALQGASVAVAECGSGWAEGCSRDNAGLIVPSHAGPFVSRSELRHAASWLFSSKGPLRIVPGVHRLRWLARAAAYAFKPGHVEKTASILASLSVRSLELHKELASAGLQTGFRQSGLLDVYETSHSFEMARRVAQTDARAGLEPRELDAGQAIAEEPMLSDRVVGGVLYPHEAYCDPKAFVQAVGTDATTAGVSLLTRTTVLAIERSTTRLHAHTTRGTLSVGQVVIAAGTYSPFVARSTYPVPVEPGKGYSVDLSLPSGLQLSRPLMLQEARVAVTPFDDRVRLAGMMEFAGRDETIDRRRLLTLQQSAVGAIPSVGSGRVSSSWTGLRPCTPDGLPMVGSLSRRGDVLLATGHAMLGMTLAPVTAELVADLLAGGHPPYAKDLDPLRFR